MHPGADNRCGSVGSVKTNLSLDMFRSISGSMDCAEAARSGC
jgi:hypothetical protein